MHCMCFAEYKKSLIKTHICFLEISLLLEEEYELSLFSFITSHYCIILRSETVVFKAQYKEICV